MARPAAFIRWLLVVGAFVFFVVQVRMFMSQTDCAGRMEKVLESEQQWAVVARGLRQNLTASQEEIQALRSKVEELQKSSRTAGEALQKASAGSQGQPAELRQEGEKVQASGGGSVPEKALLEEGESLPPGLRKLPPRLQRHSRPGTEEKAAEARPQALVSELGSQEAAEKLPPGLRRLPPRLRRHSIPGDKEAAGSPVVEAAQGRMERGGQPGQAAAGRVPGGPPPPPPQPVAAVVIMACNRADYLERTLQSVLKYHNPASGKFPLFISQDGTNAAVQAKAHSFPQFLYMQHVEEKAPQPANPGELIAYYRIAEHYKWALTQLFDVLNFPRVIILEDDMELAVDFFQYFEATADLLDTDESLMAVSSWNDNGQKQFVQDPEMLYRSDFFPGLGWMLRKGLWDELRPKWPKAYWDDWLRLEANRKGRQTIRPEICRTFNFGEQGSSMGQFYQQYLAPILLNQTPVKWYTKDLNFLLDVNYPDYFAEHLQAAEKGVSVEAVSQAAELAQDVMLEYRDETHFRQIAEAFGIFQEWKDGVARTAYQGVVAFRYKGSHRVFLTGPDSKGLLTRKPAFSSTRRRQ